MNSLIDEFQKEKLNIIEADFLKFDIGSQLIHQIKDILIIGNFPYNISSQILFKSIDNYKSISGLSWNVSKRGC